MPLSLLRSNRSYTLLYIVCVAVVLLRIRWASINFHCTDIVRMYSLSTVQGFRVALNMKIMKQLHSFALTTFCGPCGLGLKSNNISRPLPLLQEL